MTRLISAGRFSLLARALFDLQETEPLELEDLIRSVVILESDRPESSFTKQERRWHALGLSQGGVGGQFAFTGVVVPLESRVVAVVLGIVNTNTQPADVIVGELQPVVTPPALLIGELQRSNIVAPTDSRLHPGFGATMSANLVRGSSVGGLGLAAGWTLQPSTSTFYRDTPPGWVAVLGPGGFCVVQAESLGVSMSANFYGYERALVRGVQA